MIVFSLSCVRDSREQCSHHNICDRNFNFVVAAQQKYRIHFPPGWTMIGDKLNCNVCKYVKQLLHHSKNILNTVVATMTFSGLNPQFLPPFRETVFLVMRYHHQYYWNCGAIIVVCDLCDLWPGWWPSITMVTWTHYLAMTIPHLPTPPLGT